MRVAIFGAGAMGAALGARLAEGGLDVVLVDVDRARVEAIARNGLAIEAHGIRRVVTVPAVTDAAAVGPADVAVVFVKAQYTSDVGRAGRPLAESGTVFLTLQNGLGNVEALASELGDDRVLAGVTYDSAVLDEDGVVLLTGSGPTYIGEPAGPASDRVERVVRAFADAGLDARSTDDATALLWGKVLVNCVFNATCAVTGYRAGEIGEHPIALEWAERVAAETARVAEAKGITLPYDDPIERIRTIAASAGPSKPSMLQDVERGRVTEVDAINGAVVRAGREVGVATPYNEALAMLIGMVDAKHARSSG